MAGFEQVGSRVEVWPSQGRLLWNVLRDLVTFAVPLVVVFLSVEFEVVEVVLPVVLTEGTFPILLVIPFFFRSFRRVLYGLYRLAWLKPSLIIGSEGVTDRASAFGVGLVKWEEIKEVYMFEYGRHRYLGIVPLCEEGILARQNPVSRTLGRIGRSIFRRLASYRTQDTMVWIPERNLSVYVEQLLERLWAEGKKYEGYWETRINDRYSHEVNGSDKDFDLDGGWGD